MKDNESSWKEISQSWKALAKSYRADEQRYKWLYNVACHIIHDSHGMELEEVKKSIEDLWVLKEKLRKEGKTNDNK